jgi:hypothetical protein
MTWCAVEEYLQLSAFNVQKIRQLERDGRVFPFVPDTPSLFIRFFFFRNLLNVNNIQELSIIM